MKARVLLVVVVLAVVLASVGSIVAARNAVVPFKATYETYPTPAGPPVDGVLTINIPAEGKATHLGKSTWYADMWVDTQPDPPLPPMPWTQGSENMTFTAADGDQLFGTFDGFAIPTGPDSVEFWGDFQITDGSGRFSGATATGIYWGTVAGGTGTLHFDGMLTK